MYVDWMHPQGEVYPGGGGYSDIFIHTSARAIFGVQHFEFQHFWVFSEKRIFFGV